MSREGLGRSAVALLVATIVLVGGAASAAPANDRFADSTMLTGSSGRTYGSNVGAGAEPGEPAHGGFEAKRSVWWTWVAEESGRLTFFTHGSSFDTRLGLYAGESVGALALVGGNDDAGDSIEQSLVSVEVAIGSVLRIAVDGFESAGSIVLSWYLQPETEAQPLNDGFVDRVRLDGAYGRLIATNVGATREPFEPNHAGKLGNHSVWWTWTAPTGGVAVMDTGGSTFDTLLGVYHGQSLEELEAVAANDGGGVSSYVSFPVVKGVEYEIAVAGLRNLEGIIALNWQVLGECVPPPMPTGPIPPDLAGGVGASVKLEWGKFAAQRQRVIYGEDGRRDLYEVDNPDVLRAADSVVALVLIDEMTDNGDGTYSIPAKRVGQNSRLCSEELFADQPNPAWCTGFLVAPDLIATAGHCLTTTTDCARFAFVFGFRMRSPDEPILTFPKSQVYFCDGILGRELEVEFDWALARLDRPVLDHEPLELRREGRVDDAEELVVIGHPTGWPLKVAGGARVRDNQDDAFFTANLDVYGGNSGSPVLSARDFLVEGILVGGEEDFVFDVEKNCWRSNWCPDEPPNQGDACVVGELVTRTTEFADLVTASPSPTTYEVYLSRCDTVPPPPELELRGEAGVKEWTVEGLEPEALYCWKIVVKRECGRAEGPLWTFRTGFRLPEFVRGDTDADGSRNVTDAVSVLNFLFAGGEEPSCASAADVDDDGSVNVTDPVALLNFLFGDGVAIPPPLECGPDPTPDDLTCEVFERCG